MQENLVISKKPKVCFVAPYCYPLFNTHHQTMFGGWEVRIALIAKELVKRGNYAVSILVADHGQPPIDIIEGVELIAWKGKVFWGIPPVLDTLTNSRKPSGLPASEPEPLPSSTIQPSTEIHLSPVAIPSSTQQGGRFPAQTLKQLSSILKRLYKSLVPWKARIVFTGFLAGFRAGISYFFKEMFRPIWNGVNSITRQFKQFLAATKRVTGKAIKTLFRPVRVALMLFTDQMRLSLSISKRAVGNIADEPVYPEMVNMFTEAGADIYVVPGNNQISAEVAWFCRKNKRAYIMMAGSDIDFSPEIREKPKGMDLYGTRYLYKQYALQNASAHIVQNEQQFKLARMYGCSPVLIPNPVDLNPKYKRTADPKVILWVGNTVERVKRPSIFVEAARRLPIYQFLMIVTTEQQHDYEQLAQAVQSTPNVSLLNRVPYAEIERYFAQAKLFVSTSSFEGFPNTFLQSGKYGIPIVSLAVDPNGIISQHGCGALCNDNVENLVVNIQKMMTDQDLYTKMSENILSYSRRYHDKEQIIPQYEAVFQSVLKQKKIR